MTVAVSFTIVIALMFIGIACMTVYMSNAAKEIIRIAEKNKSLLKRGVHHGYYEDLRNSVEQYVTVRGGLFDPDPTVFHLALNAEMLLRAIDEVNASNED